MSMIIRIIISAGLLSGFAACGGAGNPLDFDGPAPFGAITSDEAAIIDRQYTTQSDAIMDIDPTPIGEVPDSGTATFTGMARIVVDPASSAETMTLTGDAVMQIDFADPLITAEMNNFTGADMLGGNVRLDGSLIMDNGLINTATQNSFVGSFRGILLGNNVDIQASTGAFTGVFRGTPTVAASFSGLDDTALYNGEAARITLTGFAED